MGNDDVLHSVMCPLVEREIEDIDCIENRDVVDEMISENSMLDEYKAKENWKDICRSCKYFDY